MTKASYKRYVRGVQAVQMEAAMTDKPISHLDGKAHACEHGFYQVRCPKCQEATQASKNTDRELFREKPGDYYSPSCHVTEDSALGINVGGSVRVMPLKGWHALDKSTRRLLEAVKRFMVGHPCSDTHALVCPTHEGIKTAIALCEKGGRDD